MKQTTTALLAAGTAAVYGGAHTWWALGHEPASTMMNETDVFGPWTPVAFAALAIVVAAAIALLRSRGAATTWTLAVAGAVAAAGLIATSFLLALNISGLLFGFGLTEPSGMVVRAVGVCAGVLMLLTAVTEFRRARQSCPHCGRVHGRSAERRTDPTPWWAYVAGYAAVAGCLSRFTAQAITGFPGQEERVMFTPIVNQFTVFVVLMFIAGTLLPLALVHRWGRIWPRWVLPFAGRDVPRWLVLITAFVMGAGLTAYFGLGGIPIMLADGVGEYPVWWGFAVIGGYTVWGLGLLVASVSYFALTKPSCDGTGLRGWDRAGSSDGAGPDRSASVPVG